jgi:hypothetical protein
MTEGPLSGSPRMSLSLSPKHLNPRSKAQTEAKPLVYPQVPGFPCCRTFAQNAEHALEHPIIVVYYIPSIFYSYMGSTSSIAYGLPPY